MKINRNSFLGLSIRGATLASKFLLITYLAKYSTFEIVAQYSIVVVSISYFLYLLGFDFYTYSSREILKIGFHNSAKYIVNQFVFYGAMYLISIPFVFFLSIINIINIDIIILFYCVLITEHLSQEFMRLLVINNKALKANIQLFLRTASWVYIYICFSYIRGVVSIDTLLISWLTANIIALIYSLTELRYINWRIGSSKIIDFKWLYRGVIIAIPLLCATLLLRGIFVSDRFILKFLSSTQELAVYSFFSSMANALIAFVDAAVIMQCYPPLIKAYQNNDKISYNKQLEIFKNKMIYIGGLTFLGLSIIIPVLSFYLGHREYLESVLIFYILLLSSFIYSYGLVYHYELYSRNKDFIILFSTLISFGIGVAFQYFLGSYFNGLGVSCGVLISSLFLLVTKKSYVIKVKKELW
ncbi:hypothetical protein PF050_08660 [Kosakonia pseudosacchari]|uniref:hypothetical protein n=1 Tax=Kosakonia pseudosacchari TaxID=1646340 RepID=UPI0022F06E62|nr:hypothetical protein [Kosakonia pseudosacchari]WBU50968.1 hypothetical protein PF050_08660 [Kosakonia pseudosacchari]